MCFPFDVENINPIPLLRGREFKKEEYYNRTQAFVIGWGNTSDRKDLCYLSDLFL